MFVAGGILVEYIVNDSEHHVEFINLINDDIDPTEYAQMIINVKYPQASIYNIHIFGEIAHITFTLSKIEQNKRVFGSCKIINDVSAMVPYEVNEIDIIVRPGFEHDHVIHEIYFIEVNGELADIALWENAIGPWGLSVLYDNQISSFKKIDNKWIARGLEA
ncbi:hypothetical protein D3C78_17900 [compost metagenome]